MSNNQIMTNEEKIKTELAEQFGFSTEQIRVARERRIFMETPLDRFRQVLEHAVHKLEFRHLCTISGLDEGESLAFIYHLSRPDGIVLNLKTRVPKANPVLQTISDVFAEATAYERELVDLLGAQVEGLPPGSRYPLPDSWPEGAYPLRKDFNVKTLDEAQTPKEANPYG